MEKPNLNASMVRAAIESIKEEEEERQSSHRRRRANSGSERQGNTNNSHKRTLSESSVGCAVVSNKRACTRRSDGHLSAAEELDEAVVEEEDRASDAGGDGECAVLSRPIRHDYPCDLCISWQRFYSSRVAAVSPDEEASLSLAIPISRRKRHRAGYRVYSPISTTTDATLTTTNDNNNNG